MVMDAVDQARCVVVAVNDHDILVRIVFSELRSGTLGEGGLVIVITIVEMMSFKQMPMTATPGPPANPAADDCQRLRQKAITP